MEGTFLDQNFAKNPFSPLRKNPEGTPKKTQILKIIISIESTRKSDLGMVQSKNCENPPNPPKSSKTFRKF